MLREDLQTFRSVSSNLYNLCLEPISAFLPPLLPEIIHSTAIFVRVYLLFSARAKPSCHLILLSLLFLKTAHRFSSDAMRRLSGDFLQGPHNICKSQMHVILQKGNSQIKCSSCLHVLASDLILLLLLLFCRISRCQYVLYATSPSPSREGRCPTLKWASTSTGTADRTPLRERERFPSALTPLALPSVCRQNNRVSCLPDFHQ